MIQDVGNVELFELFETDPETHCKECLSYWIQGVFYCTDRFQKDPTFCESQLKHDRTEEVCIQMDKDAPTE